LNSTTDFPAAKRSACNEQHTQNARCLDPKGPIKTRWRAL
jgi:hypothetical protein